MTQRTSEEVAFAMGQEVTLAFMREIRAENRKHAQGDATAKPRDLFATMEDVPAIMDENGVFELDGISLKLTPRIMTSVPYIRTNDNIVTINVAISDVLMEFERVYPLKLYGMKVYSDETSVADKIEFV